MKFARLLFVLLVVLIIVAGCGATPGPGAGSGTDEGDGSGDGAGDGAGGGASSPGPALHDTIAYVPTASGDEIRVIEPDGENHRLLWTHGQADAAEAYALWDLDWSPDARQIAFTGNHEMECSLHYSDVYAVGTHGKNYRRLSGPPACAALAGLPQATVKVPVRNTTMDSVDIFLYYLGAYEAKQVSLPPGGSTVVTFESVADFGPGVEQYGMLIQAERRELAASTALDVQAGATQTTAEQNVWTPGSPGWEARSPSWNGDGSRVGYAYSFNTLYTQLPTPEALSLGDELLDAPSMPNVVMHFNWNPATAWPKEFIYSGYTFDANKIFWAREGGTTAGEELLSFGPAQTVLGLAWLPDGSGFIYSVREGAAGDYSDLWEFDLESKTSTRITAFTGEFAGELSVSPNGQEIVFERASELNPTGNDLVSPDLWIVGRNGNDLRLLVEEGADPDWSDGQGE